MSPLRIVTIAACFALFANAGSALAQCGYGTSEQDCQLQQRDAQARSEADQENLRQIEARRSADDGGEGYAQPAAPSGPPPPAYGYVAVAWHSGATDVWATWNRRTEDDAVAAALNACRMSMGEGCTLALSAWNSTVAVAKATDGGLRVGWGANPDEAARQAMAECQKYLPGCTVKHRFTAKPWSVAADYFPGTATRAVYAMIGWPKSRPAPAWLDKVWFVSGQGDHQRSAALLLDRCKRDTGIECQIAHTAMADTATRTGGVIASFYNPRRGTMWLASYSRSGASAGMERDCRADGTTCENLVTYDTFAPRLQVLDQAPPR